jgi:hypothetical protein
VEATTASWNYWFSHLLGFIEREGNGRVPTGYTTPSGHKLGNWVGTQRKNKDKLSPERFAKLDNLKEWVWDSFSAQWDEGFSHLLDFIEREGNGRVPTGYTTPSSYKLGSWVSRQRKDKDKLSPERFAKLDTLKEWTWDLFSAQWDEAFSHLLDFIEREGSGRVPKGCTTPSGYKLASWVSNQRTNKDKLSPKRFARLDTLEEWTWNSFSAQWGEAFSHLLGFIEREGNGRVPTGYTTPSGYKLAIWISNQRTNKDKLSPERFAKLDNLQEFVWNVRS